MKSIEEKIEYLLNFYTQRQLDKYVNGDENKITFLYEQCQPKHVPIESLKNKVSNTFVTSPDGFVPVTDCIEKTKNNMYLLTFDTNQTLTVSSDHLFQKLNESWVYAHELVIGDRLLHQNGTCEIVDLNRYNKSTQVYDLSVNHCNHRYYTHGVCSHNSGKSTFLANLGVNWALAGYNVLYITLELSENLVSMRMDSMISGIPSREIFKKLDDVTLKVTLAGKNAGAYQVKYMDSGSNVTQIRSFIKEYQVKFGKSFDVILVDYLDIVDPATKKVKADNLFVKDKYVSEELRNLGMEYNCLVVTAAQFNRSGVDEIEYDHSNISGGISKINTADNVFGIHTSKAMRDRGEYQLQLMKTRNSGGVGSKVTLDFNVETLRITDPGKEPDDTPQPSANEMANSLTRNSNPGGKGSVDSSKLREFLKNRT